MEPEGVILMESIVLNERLKSGYSMVVINGKKIDMTHLTNYLVETLLPDMVRHNESYFFWNFNFKDISCLKEELYTKEKDSLIKDNFKCDNFDTLWKVNFSMPDGTKMKAEISSEVWYKEEEEHQISPFAFVFDAPFAAGYMYSKVSFSKS
jgi:hypothetical protein